MSDKVTTIVSVIENEILERKNKTYLYSGKQNIIYDWEIHKGRLEVFDEYGIRYIFY
jgi:hypothetical protein